jgi:hypothetical protein
VASIEHRLFGEAPFPAQIELEGRGDNMSYSSCVQAVCDVSGPADLLRLYHDASDASTGTRPQAISYIGALLGGPAEQNKTKAMAASPITYVSKR